MLNIYHIEKANNVNGNGCRYIIWLQGCRFYCKACWNKQTWHFKKNKILSIDQILNDIKKQPNLQGITLTGGEPLLQANELIKLIQLIKQQTSLELHIFTGFEQAENKTANQQKLINFADTIVFGRFDTNIENNNQQVINQKSKSSWQFNNTDIEIEIDEDLNIVLTGYPTDKLINQIKIL